MAYLQKRLVSDAHGQAREVQWEMDLDVLAATQAWARRRPRLDREVSAMREMYPTWVLTVASGTEQCVRRGRPDADLHHFENLAIQGRGKPLRTVVRGGAKFRAKPS